MSAPLSPRSFAVDPARLASGTWCHVRDRQIGEGDISASYSADKIALEGRVRAPFQWQSTLWVCIGMRSLHGNRSAEAYRLVAERFFDGTPISYAENAMLGDAARTRPQGFYHGMAVRHGGNAFVLVGPAAIFVAAQERAQQQGDLFDGF